MDFQAPYKRDDFIDFCLADFLPDDFDVSIQPVNVPFSHEGRRIRSAVRIGNVDSLELRVLEITHESEHDPRVTLSREAFRLMSSMGLRRALVAFVSENSENYRISLVTIELVPDESRGFRREYSNPRRYSFFLGPEAKVHTPYNFLGKKRVGDFDDLQSRFSVEVVNRDFYQKIARMFSHLVGGRRKVGSKYEDFDCTLQLPSVKKGDIKCKEFTVRLIGRIIFCWFLKKKTSNNGLPLIPDNMLSVDAALNTGDYYHTVLEPLFFEVLNTPRDKRKPDFLSGDFSDIPFLNGGLFEPKHDDYYDKPAYLNTLKIPDDWFVSFFEILETYNFTIDENTTVDVDLSIDPEMLGRIFENLLAEINPETEESARKSTGSYYTPRPIVDYMVNESLKQYLTGYISRNYIDSMTTGFEEEQKQHLLFTDESSGTDLSDAARENAAKNLEHAVDSLLSYEDESGMVGERELNDAEREVIINALDSIRIIDPACGSGAFPMGVLQKMVLVLQKVDPDSVKWLSRLLGSVKDPTGREMMRKKLENEQGMLDYTRKLGIIRKSIYGIDIQPIAVEIAKLRFFLSLIVDENVIDEVPNRAVEPLPNLDFKFVCANSLIDVPGEDEEPGGLIMDDFFTDLEACIAEYFQASDPEIKLGLHKRIEALIDGKVKEKESHINNFINRDFDKKYAKLTKKEQKLIDDLHRDIQLWESYKNVFNGDAVGFFNTRYFFPEVRDGFDVVIANPPYVRQEQLKDIKHIFQEKYTCYTGTADLYVYFYERGIELLREQGILTFISSNKYFRSGYGSKLREYISDNTTVVQIIDFGDAQIFSAIAYPSIIVLRKEKSDKNVISACEWNLDRPVDNFAAVVDSDSIQMPQNELTSSGWRIGSPEVLRLMEKISSSGVPLGEYVNGRMYRGILTGFNEAFVIDRTTRDRLVAEDPGCADIIKPFLRGRDVKRWCVESEDLWLIFIPWHFPLHNDPSIQGASEKAEKELISKYPSVYKHLLKYKSKLEKRNKEETGIRYEWYALQRCAATYYDEFEETKIVWGNLSKESMFSFLDPGVYINAPACIIVSDSKYLLGILNSRLAQFFVIQSAAVRQGGFVEFKPMYVSGIPIVANADQNLFTQYVEELLETKQNECNFDVSLYEEKINIMVYKLYGLAYKEVLIIDPEFSMSEEEYNRYEIN